MQPMHPASLIGVNSWREFLAAFRERRTVVRPTTEAADRLPALWAEWLITALARFTPAPGDRERFRLLSRGKTVPANLYQDAKGAFREVAFQQWRAGGASLALGNFEHYSNGALALSRHLERELGVPAQVNLYVTPPGNQGLGSHTDPHDVLILQLLGEKTWDIYDGPDADDPSVETVLPQGGWLFLPKGVRHEVANRGARPSVHFTIGFHPLTWGEVFQRALQRARVASPEMNDALLPGAAGESGAGMQRRLAAVLSRVDVPDHLGHYYANFPALGVTVPDTETIPPPALAALDAGAAWSWRPGAALEEAAGIVSVTRPYRRAPLILRPEWAEPIRAMRAAGRFTPEDLPGRPDDLILLARFLAGIGVLETA